MLPFKLQFYHLEGFGFRHVFAIATAYQWRSLDLKIGYFREYPLGPPPLPILLGDLHPQLGKDQRYLTHSL
jgi:hypothetical protein